MEIVQPPPSIIYRADGRPQITAQHIQSYHHFVNTREFRKSALHFIKHGCYTKYRKDHPQYKVFWDIETDRCINGYKVGDLWIPGKYYFYLNYIPIKKIPDKDYLEIHPKASKNTPVLTFPSFWEIDYCWFMLIEMCEQNAEDGSLFAHKVCLKTRQGGFSFKEASEGVWNFTFLKYSITKYYAATEAYLIKDGIFNKVTAMLNHLNQHTTWKQQRREKDDMWHKKGSWIDKKNRTVRGRQNELIAQILDNPDKGRGGNAIKATYEESGNMKYLIEAWLVNLPQVVKGGRVTGFMTAFGTGGTKEAEYLDGLQEMFYNPSTYFCIPFENKWDDGFIGTECGFFVPAYYTYEQAMDKDGNINVGKALDLINKEREIISKSKFFERHKAENPLTPTEALTSVKISMFNKEEVKRQRLKITKDPDIKNLFVTGKFEGDYENVKFKVTNEQALYEYPITKDSKDKNCVVIFETPYKDINGFIPENLYLIGFDPYYKDAAEYSESVGASYVFKRNNQVDSRGGNYPVAWYVARPETKEMYFEQLVKMAIHYNAKIQFEIDGGGEAFFTWVKNNNLLHLLYYEPEMFTHKEIVSERNRSYGIKMGGGKEKKESMLSLFADYLDGIRGISIEGNVILNYSRIMDEGLLNELEKHKEGGNFDRISAMVIVIVQCLELDKVEIETKSKKDISDSVFSKAFNDNLILTNTNNYVGIG